MLGSGGHALLTQLFFALDMWSLCIPVLRLPFLLFLATFIRSLLGSQAVVSLVERLPNLQLPKMSASLLSLLSLQADLCLSFQLLLR